MKIKQQNKWGLSLLFAFNLFTLSAQNIGVLFEQMPDRFHPTLTAQNRMEMVEYYKAHQTDSVKNRFNGSVRIERMDTTLGFLSIATGSTRFEMMIIRPKEEVPFIGIIQSVCAPVCHSVVNFYDLGWKKKNLLFPIPLATEWIDPEKVSSTDIDQKWLMSVLENSFIELKFIPETNQVEARNKSLEFMSDDERKIITPLLKTEPIKLTLAKSGK